MSFLYTSSPLYIKQFSFKGQNVYSSRSRSEKVYNTFLIVIVFCPKPKNELYYLHEADISVVNPVIFLGCVFISLSRGLIA